MTLSKQKKIPLIIGASLLLLVLLVSIAWSRYFGSLDIEGYPCRMLYLPHGTSRAAMADSLSAVLGSGNASKVMTVYNLAATKDTPIYGAYQVSRGDSPVDVAKRLARHRQTPIRLTFNNIRTFDQLAERIASQMEFTAEDFAAACDSVLPSAGFKPAEYVAAFFPDTYECYWTASAANTVERMLQVRNAFWTDERRAQAKALGLTPVGVATIASIAEEETNAADERPIIGRLYINRLQRGMNLQACPTVKFALGDFSLRRILNKHLQTPSPYNTYINPGLPPGPIRVANKSTIEAVLNSVPNDFLYMCAKEDFSGRHNFAHDFATHQANARRYQRALDKANLGN